MRWSLSRLRPLYMALASVAYWVGIATVKLGAAIVAAWQISRLPPNHGSISATLQDTLLHLTMMRDDAVLWSGSASLGTIVLWVLGPPALLALTWRWTREVDAAVGPPPEPMRHAPAGGSTVPLPAPPMPWPADRGDQPEATRVINPRPGSSERHHRQE